MERNNTNRWMLVSFDSWKREVLTSVGVPKELAEAMLTDSELLSLYRLGSRAIQAGFSNDTAAHDATTKLRMVLKLAGLLQ